MPDITRVRMNKVEQLNERQLTRYYKKEMRKELQQKQKLEHEYFSYLEEQGATFAKHISSNIVQEPVTINDLEHSANIQNELAQFTSAHIPSQMVAKFLETHEHESLVEFVEKFKDNNYGDEDLDKLLRNSSSKAKIYLKLLYLSDLFSKSGENGDGEKQQQNHQEQQNSFALNKIKDTINRLLHKIESQNSAYLEEYFHISKLVDNSDSKLAESFANLHNGKTPIADCMAVLNFITDLKLGSLDNLYSQLIKYRLQNLHKINQMAEGREKNVRLLEHIQFDKSIKLIHSVHRQIKFFLKTTAKDSLKLVTTTTPSAMVHAVLSLCQMNTVSLVVLQKFMREFGVESVSDNLEQKINKFIKLFIELPTSVYVTLNQKSKFVDTLRNILKTYTPPKKNELFDFVLDSSKKYIKLC